MQIHRHQLLIQRFVLFFIYLTIALAHGCGNGRSEPDDNSNQTPPTGAGGIAQVSPNGLYVGNYTAASGAVHEVQGMIYDGRLIFVSGGDLFDGTITATGTQFVADAKVYATSGLQYNNAIFTGQFEPQARMFGVYTSILGNSGTFDLLFNPAYLKGASLGRISAKWKETSEFPRQAEMLITATGDFSGVDKNGCTYTGTISAPDPVANMYLVDGRLTNCKALAGLVNFNGRYTGYATLVDTVEADDTMLFNMSNGKVIYASVFQK